MNWRDKLDYLPYAVAGATVWLIVAKPKSVLEGIGGFVAGLLIAAGISEAIAAHKYIMASIGVGEGTKGAIVFAVSFGGYQLAIRAKQYLEYGKLPFVGGKPTEEKTDV